MANINMAKSFNTPAGRILGLAAVGFLLWRNRFKIQEMLESRGIDTPWMNKSLGEAMKSGVAKLKGSAKYDVGSVDRGAAI